MSRPCFDPYFPVHRSGQTRKPEAARACGKRARLPNPATPPSDNSLVSQVEFIRVLDCEERICEFNQEACRVNAYNGKKSLIRSFP